MGFGGWFCWGLGGEVRIPAQDEEGGLRFYPVSEYVDSPWGGVVGGFWVSEYS